MVKWLKNKLRVWLGVKAIHSSVRNTYNIVCEIDRRLNKLEEELDRVSGLSIQNKNKINSSMRVVDSMRSQLDDTSKAMSDVYKTVESVVSIGADVQPNSMEDKSWAVVCVEGKMNIVKFLPLNHKDAHSILQYLKQFPTSKSVYDTPPFWKDFGW